MGQLERGTVTLVETEADVAGLDLPDPDALGYVTQTTLSVEDTAGVIRALEERFPALQPPASESICYATTNRQEAVKLAAPGTDLFLVVGAPNSSNSRRLVEVAERAGAARGGPSLRHTKMGAGGDRSRGRFPRPSRAFRRSGLVGPGVGPH